MKDKVYIIAVVVIVCLIFWRKSIVNKRGKDQKSIDTSSKAKNYSKKEDLHKMSETRTNEETFFKNAPEVKEKEAYDGSRKKDRGKKRREKKKSNQKKSLIFISTAKSGGFFITFIAIGYAVIAVITES